MERVNHTPGPWHRNIPPANRYPVIFAGRNTHIAIVATGARHGQTLSDAEIEANADLITASTEMLAALKAFVEPYAHLIDRQLIAASKREVSAGLSPHTAQSVLQARAAIAKAEGRT